MGTDRGVAAAILRGESGGRELGQIAATSRRLILAAIVLSNIVGAAIVVLLIAFVLPPPDGVGRGFGGSSAAAVGALGYLVVAVLVGATIGLRFARPVKRFYDSSERPTESDRRAVLHLPVQLLKLQAVLWAVGALVFGLAALGTSGLLAVEVAITVILAGIPTACLAYLLTQRLLRVGVAAVLASAPPRTREVPGVRPRSLLAWALGVVPILGVAALAAFVPFTHVDEDALARAVGVLAGVAVVVGFLATFTIAQSIAEPLVRLRAAFADVEAGDFDVDVPVFDATEVGYAISSFNQMAAGLAERERLRDLFGRQVGVDVAQQALDEGVTLGGEEREAAALFVDVVGSTSFAADRPPREVVDALNQFFDAVVTATQEHGGFVNKFVGDAALCVFGAPLASDDAAGSALAAAREMAARLQDGPLRAGIGVAYGVVVAGNVGNAERYEYTVIGDPVNEAARLTEIAKQRAGVVASDATVDAAAPGEARRWRLGDEVTLRGRSRPTRLAEPVEG